MAALAKLKWWQLCGTSMSVVPRTFTTLLHTTKGLKDFSRMVTLPRKLGDGSEISLMHMSAFLKTIKLTLRLNRCIIYVPYDSSTSIAGRHSLGVISIKENLEICDRVTASSFCRRRLPVIMVRNQMAQRVKMATQFVEQGHVRIGPDVVTDPAFLVSRQLEDFVTWTDSSAIKKHVAEYNDMRDDYDLL